MKLVIAIREKIRRLICAPILFVLLCLCAPLFTSCSHLMGYGVLLWDLPEQNLQDGDILPVYIRSNISHVYVVGIPGKSSKDKGSKIEIPLWQITQPQSKGKAVKLAAKYAEFKHQYARVALDGLPVRNGPVNTSKQVYRLRKNEVIKLLYKGKGQIVMAGKTPLAGDWLYVLTKEGTTGWCFSYNLRQFATGPGGVAIGDQTESIQKQNPLLDAVLAKHWYPDYYASMLNSGHIDPDSMNPEWGFDSGVGTGTTKLDLMTLHRSWPYTGITQNASGDYKFNDIPLVMTIKNDSFIVLSYTDEDGKPVDYNFITIDTDIAAAVQAEKDRRAAALAALVAFGPSFKSSNYGQLTFTADNGFTWTGYSLLVPSVIPQAARGGGTVLIKYFLSKSFTSSYDGVLTFHFEGVDSDINFLYKIEDNGLRLEDATGANFNANTVVSRGISPLILFFAR